jgi:hypothetical protein
MIGGWGYFSRRMLAPSSLADIGGYLRPAGRSLAIVIDTLRLDTKRPLFGQIEAVVEGLEAALRLQSWWNANHQVLLGWLATYRQAAGYEGDARVELRHPQRWVTSGRFVLMLIRTAAAGRCGG